MVPLSGVSSTIFDFVSIFVDFFQILAMSRDGCAIDPLHNVKYNCAMLVDSEVTSYVRVRRLACGLSQQQLAQRVGVTRQAISAMEGGQYSPGTAVALKLAEVLSCRVDDLFRLKTQSDIVGTLAQPVSGQSQGRRVKLVRIGGRMVVWPIEALTPLINFVAADSVISQNLGSGGQVNLQLYRDIAEIESQIAIAGCDPAISLAAEYMARSAHGSLFAAVMGSTAALQTLQENNVHVAGVHFVDAATGECNLPYLRRNLAVDAYLVVTFAAWQEGLILANGNPKTIRNIADIVREDVRFVNREPGSGARQLIDAELTKLKIDWRKVSGYDRTVRSHIEAAWMVNAGVADVAVGIQSAAVSAGLAFIPLRQERYDLVIPRELYSHHPSIKAFLDVIVSGSFRSELAAIGGYDTRDTGKTQELRPRS